MLRKGVLGTALRIPPLPFNSPFGNKNGIGTWHVSGVLGPK